MRWHEYVEITLFLGMFFVPGLIGSAITFASWKYLGIGWTGWGLLTSGLLGLTVIAFLVGIFCIYMMKHLTVQ